MNKRFKAPLLLRLGRRSHNCGLLWQFGQPRKKTATAAESLYARLLLWVKQTIFATGINIAAAFRSETGGVAASAADIRRPDNRLALTASAPHAATASTTFDSPKASSVHGDSASSDQPLRSVFIPEVRLDLMHIQASGPPHLAHARPVVDHEGYTLARSE